MDNCTLKTSVEKFVCESFLRTYNRNSENKPEFVRLGDPTLREPDCICSNGIGIEIVGIYDNEYQAEKIWSLARQKEPRKNLELRLYSFENLGRKISEKIDNLEKGKYAGHSGKIILVCHLQSPLLETKEIDTFINQHVSFRSDAYFEKYFDEIWIMWKENDGSINTKKLE